MSSRKRLSLEKAMEELERKEEHFRRACDQIVLLNERLCSSAFRYKHARRNDMKSFRYPLRLRLSVIEGIRNMFYEYAKQKAVEVQCLRRALSDHVTVPEVPNDQ
ncbi:hypothetical protein DPMN_057142 [Dreissena polymorpha]|uniref:Uncharacterized protein n=1 Tax=Dreissena polymorpha TaxID=45954 RepID=A0A9D4CVN5_DREPO|nr:hypothetical protein DPMN_057142 [Dreissena polymorpha]